LVSLIERHRPLDAIYSAYPIELGIEQWLGVVDELYFGVHNPYVRQANVGNETVGVRQDADQDAGLLDHDDRGQSDAGYDPNVLATVAEEHFEGYFIHWSYSNCGAEYYRKSS